MATHTAPALLLDLQRRHVARRGERAVDVELAAGPGSDDLEPVLLLTSAALYVRSAAGWCRVPLGTIRQVEVSTDSTGMVTRYRVVDRDGAVQAALALPLASTSFRQRMERLAERAARPAAAPRVTVARSSLLSSATGWRLAA